VVRQWVAVPHGDLLHAGSRTGRASPAAIPDIRSMALRLLKSLSHRPSFGKILLVSRAQRRFFRDCLRKPLSRLVMVLGRFYPGHVREDHCHISVHSHRDPKRGADFRRLSTDTIFPDVDPGPSSSLSESRDHGRW